jgi:cytochrome b involved in lipid metabolism
MTFHFQFGFGKPESVRKKVELGEGKGLVQWIRLSDSRNLASQKLEYVDDVELAKHNKEDDCWVLLFDMVSIICYE